MDDNISFVPLGCISVSHQYCVSLELLLPSSSLLRAVNGSTAMSDAKRVRNRFITQNCFEVDNCFLKKVPQPTLALRHCICAVVKCV